MKSNFKKVILGIESSCDDTAAAVCVDGKVLTNVIANQSVHAEYGGVVPELASRAHLSNIIPTINAAVDQAGLQLSDLDAIAVTQGPGLLGSLIVGVSAAKGLAAGLGIPLLPVNHMDAHIMSCFIEPPVPSYPFLCLTVSGGHTQLTIVRAVDKMEVVGRTRDDAAGEAFDKIGKLLGLPYPAGPQIDQLAAQGTPRYPFTHADIPGFDFSFSGLKTQVRYFIRDEMKKDAQFLERNRADLAASVRKIIVDMLMSKLTAAADEYQMKSIAIAGGVSANRLLRETARTCAEEKDWELHIPSLQYCTDNAAMIAITGYHRFLAGIGASSDFVPYSKSR